LLPFIRFCKNNIMSDRGCSHLDAIDSIKRRSAVNAKNA
jgi:hypothetical protein